MSPFKARYLLRKCAQYVGLKYPGALCHFKANRGDTCESVWSTNNQFIFVAGRYMSNKEVELQVVSTTYTQSYTVPLLV